MFLETQPSLSPIRDQGSQETGSETESSEAKIGGQVCTRAPRLRRRVMCAILRRKTKLTTPTRPQSNENDLQRACTQITLVRWNFPPIRGN